MVLEIKIPLEVIWSVLGDTGEIIVVGDGGLGDAEVVAAIGDISAVVYSGSSSVP